MPHFGWSVSWILMSSVTMVSEIWEPRDGIAFIQNMCWGKPNFQWQTNNQGISFISHPHQIASDFLNSASIDSRTGLLCENTASSMS